ncbi:CARDB domain-containing protein [Hydrogenophaga sp.]|jgi:hypothetical protein|uniref:CARDB domain-containing protein n=1 Tax=Hydrogenophaga sp. TaxID=1904254 RepID=UPI003F70F917
MNTIATPSLHARHLLLVLCIAAATTSLGARAQGTAHLPTFPAGPAALASNEKPDLFIYRHYGSPEEAGSPRGYPYVEFCGGHDGQGGPARRVYFEVFNRGAVATPASQVRVQFTNPQTHQVRVVNVAVAPLAPQANLVKRVPIPPGCYSAGSSAQCNFTITADPDQQVAERFENNNAQRSYCVGPSF